MALPTDLKTLILSYLPLPQLQLVNDGGYVNSNNFKLLLANNYNTNSILPAFDQFCRLKMLDGQAGYNGQWYLPIYACVFNCIFNNKLDLLDYYLIRFFSRYGSQTLKVINWPLDDRKFATLIFYLINNYITNFHSKLHFNAAFRDYIPKNSFIEYGLDQPRVPESNDVIDALIQIDPNSIQLNAFLIDLKLGNIDFPYIAIHNIRAGLIERFIIDINIINNAKIMINKLSTITNKNNNLLRYINVLNILINNDIDLTLFNITSNEEEGGNDEAYDLISLAASVLNGKVLNKLQNTAIHFNDYVDDLVNYVFSEILYDLNFYNLVKNDVLQISVYLSKKGYIFINNLSNIDITFNKLNGDQSVFIYDPETALFLANYLGNDSYLIKPHLQPLTTFDKDLMIQFGLFK